MYKKQNIFKYLLPQAVKIEAQEKGERHIPLTLQSPRGLIWLEGGKGFNLRLIQLLLKWKFRAVLGLGGVARGAAGGGRAERAMPVVTRAAPDRR